MSNYYEENCELNCEKDDYLSFEVSRMFGDSIGDMLSIVTSCMYCGLAIAKKGETFVLWNKRATQILGMGVVPSSVEDWPEIYGVYDPDTEEKMEVNKVPLADALEGNYVRDRILLIKNPKKTAYINCNASPILDANENVVGGLVIFTDITKIVMQQKVIEELKCKGLTIDCIIEKFSNIDKIINS